jgi:hypothetical protein
MRMCLRPVGQIESTVLYTWTTEEPSGGRSSWFIKDFYLVVGVALLAAIIVVGIVGFMMAGLSAADALLK